MDAQESLNGWVSDSQWVCRSTPRGEERAKSSFLSAKSRSETTLC